jgi:hypothetical protein
MNVKRRQRSNFRLNHICDLGDLSVLRVLRGVGDVLVVETTARKKQRIAEIDHQSGTFRITQTSRPLLNLNTSSWSGDRWVTTTTRKAGNCGPSTTVKWQDSEAGKVFSCVIQDSIAKHTLCPRNSKLVIVGTRTNSMVGDGSVHGLTEGKLCWSYHPTEEVKCAPSWKSGPPRVLRAFPYHTSVPDGADFICFSFMNFLYLLDASGQLVRRWETRRLLKQIFNREFRTVDQMKSTSEFEVDGDVFEFASSIKVSPEPYEHPVVGALHAFSAGNAFLFASRNAIVWMTANGMISHALLLPVGSPVGMGSWGAITKLRASDSGDLIIADVARTALVAISKGKCVGTTRSQGNTGPVQWELSPTDPIVAIVRAVPRITLSLYSPQWELCDSVNLDSIPTSIQFSADGKFLFANGATSYVFSVHRGNRKA